MKKETKYNIQLAMAITTLIAGIVLMFISLFFPPQGELHWSVLSALGELLTFSGAVIGIDYHYKDVRTNNNDL